MRDSTGAPDETNRGFRRWQRDNLLAYDPARLGVKAKEDTLLPLAPGPFDFDAEVVNYGDVSLVRVRVRGKSSGTTVLEPDSLCFLMPVYCTGDYSLNGEPADLTNFFLTADTDCVNVRGGSRLTLGVVLPRTAFIESVAALRGVEPADLMAADRHLTHTPAAASALRRRLTGIIDASLNQALPRLVHEMAHDVFTLMADAYLGARPGTPANAKQIRQPSRIVRVAEERFMAAEGHPISLADLCAAAGVSKSTLYLAFDRVCGQPPLQYFHKRRLARARLRLMDSSPQRGAVKRVALETGFTELGRFAVEYRRMFGESPSATLASSSR